MERCDTSDEKYSVVQTFSRVANHVSPVQEGLCSRSLTKKRQTVLLWCKRRSVEDWSVVAVDGCDGSWPDLQSE